MKKFFGRIGKFFKDIKAELKKVIWPTRKQLTNNTLIVLACILLIGAAIWILDFAFGAGADFVLGR